MRAIVGRAVLFLGAILPVACSGQASSGPIYLGHVTPLTGKDKLPGKHAEQGVTLAVEEANRDGGFPDGRSVNVLHADDQGDGEKAPAEATRLITINKVSALLGDLDAGRTARIARAAKSYGVAVVAPEGVPPAEGGDNTLSLNISPARQGRALAGFVKSGLGAGLRCCIVLADDSEGGRARADAFAENLRAAKHPVEQKTLKNDSDMPGVVDTLKGYDPGAILVVGADPATLGNLRTNNQLLLQSRTTWLYAGTESQIDAVQADGRARRDLCVATVYVGSEESEKGKAFAEAYRKRFGESPDVHAVLAYESTRALCDAIRRARSAEAGRVGEELMKTGSFEGVTGPISFGPDHCARRPVFMLKLMANGPFLIYKATEEK